MEAEYAIGRMVYRSVARRDPVSKAIGQLVWSPDAAPAPEDVIPIGTVALISHDCVLTAGHNIEAPSPARRSPLPERPAQPAQRVKMMFVRFGYYRASDAKRLPLRRVAEVVEHRWGELDYAVLRLEAPVKARRPLVVAPRAVKLGEAVRIYQHPSADPMKEAEGRVVAVEGSEFRHSAFTRWGASGAPVLAKSGEILGVHVRGYKGAAMGVGQGEYNVGVCAEAIARARLDRGGQRAQGG